VCCLALVTPLVARPDVVMIVLDDLNDWITLLDKDAPIRTPNLQRLAERGVTFTRAYCASPSCNPSRTATLTGLAPFATGVYGNSSDWRGALPDAVTLPQHYRVHGYHAVGAGKIFHHHHGGAFHDATSFDLLHALPWPLDAPMPPAKLNGLPDFGSANTDWGPWPPAETDALDVRTVDACIASLRSRTDDPGVKPLFLACGLFRPHMPFFAPEKWMQTKHHKEVTMPVMKEDDLEDIPSGGRTLMANAARFYTGMMEAEALKQGSWREAVRSYQAVAEFADAQVGRLLDALDTSPRGKDTIVVLWSDHGYQLGEKQCWEKFTLWEKATRVPLIVVAPDVAAAGAVCEAPVSLLDLYPTLIELCELDQKPELHGQSLVPLLRDPDLTWRKPAVMTFEKGNHAVRSLRWRYICYADGSEELYDHQSDRFEHHNLATQPKYAEILKEHRRWLPTINAPAVPNLKAK